jgi:hypothetical protein
LPTTKRADLIYVYAAVEGTALPRLGVSMPGGTSPRTLRLQDAGALVVSDVPAATYAPEALEPRLSDLDWVGAAGAAHHAVVEAIADAGGVVLPVRLFTIFSSEAVAVSTMVALRDAMRRAFERIRGKQEWVLRIGQPEAGRMQAPADEAASRVSGTSFLKAKADARRDTALRGERTRAEAAACYHALRELAQEASMRTVSPSGNLLLDAAFLVSPPHVESLKETLAEAARRLLADGCPVSFTGPWPPYSFASLDTPAHD